MGQSSLKADGLGVFGSLILCGPVLARTGEFFVEEFACLPRIGARDWGDADEGVGTDGDEEGRRRKWRVERWRGEKERRVLWTVSRTRGLILVKFGASEVESARWWLGEMLRFEGTVEREFGPGGTMCLR